MFCDVVGSSELAQQLDAEDYMECLRRYHGACSDVVAEFDGHVAQLLGDGVLVYFGYPRAHENDAERAVRAALGILHAMRDVADSVRKEMGAELGIRIGIHTGPVVVGAVGAVGRRETLALGDTTNIAARVEAQADPDSVLVTATTLRLVGGAFTVRDVGTPRLKGIHTPVALFRVVAEAGAVVRGADMPEMVDRHDESGLLERAWKDADSRQARVIVVSGEPGVGKSRLVARLREHLGSSDHHWLALQCSPFAEARALHPWATYLADRFDLVDSVEAPALQLARLRDGLASLGASANEAAERFGRLLGIPLQPSSSLLGEAVELARHRVLEALVHWVEALAKEAPVVLLVEDLHWSDPSTLDWLRMLIERGAGRRLLCVFTHRPEFDPPWDEEHFERLELVRLGPSDTRALVEAVARGRELRGPVVDTIADRADGVPLFVEELTKMVCESSDGNLQVPSTLRDLLMARLDGLGAAKAVAQVGAVIGRDFPRSLLSAVSARSESDLDAQLDDLVQSGLVFQTGAGRDAVYTFKHALVQDTAYESLLRRRRREIHGAVASELLSRADRGVDVAAALLGHHYRGAGDWMKAAEHLDAAGRHAAGAAAFEEAQSHFRAGLDCVGRAPETLDRQRRELSLTIMLGNALMSTAGFQSPECIEVWQRAERLALAVDDPDELSSARNGAAVYHLTNGNIDEAERYAHAVLDVAARGDARIVGLRGTMTLASCAYFRGEGRRAHELAEQSISLYRPTDFWTVTYGSNLDQGAAAYAMSAMTLSWLGRLDDALVRAEESLALAIELSSPLSVAFARSTIWMVSVDRGDQKRLRAETEEIDRLASDLSLPLWQGFAMLAEGYLGACEARTEGIARMMEGVAIQGEQLGQSGATMGMCLLARAHLGVGDSHSAEEIVDGGLALAAAQGIPYYEDQLRILKAEVALARDPDAVEVPRRILEDARAHARSRGAKLFELRAAIGLARLLSAIGERAVARSLLEESLAGFQGDATDDGRAARSLSAELARDS